MHTIFKKSLAFAIATTTAAILFNTSSSHATDLNTIEQLGEALYSDANLSALRNQSCASCHTLKPSFQTTNTFGELKFELQHTASFSDPIIAATGIPVAAGSWLLLFGTLNPPSVGYTAFTPKFQWDENRQQFKGGQFWNGRATDLETQATKPLLNPVEMAMPSEWSVIKRLRENRDYRRAFNEVFGINLNDIKQNDASVETAFNAVGGAIASFERTKTFNRFDSKFDFVRAGMTTFTQKEKRGKRLFNGKANCNQCHTSKGHQGPGTPALFTNFSYANLGVPTNPFINNVDPGLAGNPDLLETRGAPTPDNETEGFHRVMSLRNIAITPPYMHNGMFSSLEEAVHFLNTRDKLWECRWPSNANNFGFGRWCWPKGEYHNNRDTHLTGDLGLSKREEASLVAFLRTLTDAYPEWGNDPAVPPGTPSPYAELPIHDTNYE